MAYTDRKGREWMTVDETCFYLTVKRSALQRLRSAKRGPPYTKTVSGRIMYCVEEVDAWMCSGPTRPRPTVDYVSRVRH